MTQYAILFNQQWTGDHPEEWYVPRGPLARAVVAEMEDAGVLVVAGGLVEEIEEDAFHADATSGELVISDGPYAETKEYLGGITIIDVETREEAQVWAGKVAEACGWPQEVRTFKGMPPRQA